MKAASTLFLALKLVVSAAFIGSSCCRAAAVQSDQISLAGQWRFQLDRSNTGISEQWFERSLPDKIKPVSVLTIDTVHQKSAPTNARIWRCLPA